MSEWTRETLAMHTDDQVASIADRVANRVAKWRLVFASWQLGTRVRGDPECQAVIDQRELLILLRAEVNAITNCLAEVGISPRRFTEQLILELEHLDASYAKRFPGFTSTDEGMQINPALAAKTMRGWRP